MTGLFAIIWLVGTIASIVFIFRPKKEWAPYATRLRAVGMTVAFFLGTPILMAIVAPGASGGSASSKAPEAVAAIPSKTPEQIEAERIEQATKDARRSPQDFLSLDKMSGQKAGFDTVMELGGTIKNSSRISIKDPVIECDLFAESGTKIDSVRNTVYKVVPANGSVRFTGENMGFVNSEWESYSCRVVRATAMGITLGTEP